MKHSGRYISEKIWEENSYFFWTLEAVLVTGLILLFVVKQGQEIIFLNAHRSEGLDLFFRFVTHLGEEWGYFPAIAVLLFYRFRQAIMIPLIGLAVTLVSALAKLLFAHPRPSLWFREVGAFHLLDPIEGFTLHGGANSFPSGHTMSAFALFTFLALCLPRKRGTALFLLGLAIGVGISRMYLIQHFLEDVLCGAALGALLGVLAYQVQYRLFPPPHRLLDRSLSLPFSRRAAPKTLAHPASWQREIHHPESPDDLPRSMDHSSS